MFKIGLENRDFCKSLHFYIVDAGKKIKIKQIFLKNELHLPACSAALGPCAEGIARRAFPHYFFLVLRGACQRPDILVPKTIEIIWICAAHNFL